MSVSGVRRGGWTIIHGRASRERASVPRARAGLESRSTALTDGTADAPEPEPRASAPGQEGHRSRAEPPAPGGIG